MELVFTEDIRRLDGDVRFSRGATRDFPKATWKQLALTVGRSLSEFTTSVEEAAARSFKKDEDSLNDKRKQLMKAKQRS